jgi:hypothetical protein
VTKRQRLDCHCRRRHHHLRFRVYFRCSSVKSDCCFRCCAYSQSLETKKTRKEKGEVQYLPNCSSLQHLLWSHTSCFPLILSGSLANCYYQLLGGTFRQNKHLKVVFQFLKDYDRVTTTTSSCRRALDISKYW